ncbi:unnamed protein product [Brachionus calyciflorus]|uniref:Uncharacterized protein n=1 Tax=Brachionus calyciflorus TaxID=104777 RepID=A0A813R504_9BILA|nr:unnamed protein product [Brachionus calyciflorus]
MLGINTRCRTTELFNALKIDLTRDRLESTKVELFFKINSEPFYKRINKAHRESYENPSDFINEIYKVTDILSKKVDVNVLEACRTLNTKKKIKNNEDENEIVRKLRNSFKIKNDVEMVKSVTRLCMF